MDYTKLFYWLTVADNAKTLFVTFIVIFTIIACISTICFIVGRYEDGSCNKDGLAERSKRWVWFSYPFLILFWSLYIFTPSKKDALLIVAGGQTLNFLTTDESTKQIPSELSNFILLELKSMASDAKVELGLKQTKEQLIEKAKSMTTEELIKELKVNPELKDILLTEN